MQQLFGLNFLSLTKTKQTKREAEILRRIKINQYYLVKKLENLEKV